MKQTLLKTTRNITSTKEAEELTIAILGVDTKNRCTQLTENEGKKEYEIQGEVGEVEKVEKGLEKPVVKAAIIIKK